MLRWNKPAPQLCSGKTHRKRAGASVGSLQAAVHDAPEHGSDCAVHHAKSPDVNLCTRVPVVVLRKCGGEQASE